MDQRPDDDAIASILVADADGPLCDLLAALLTEEGYRVHCVSDGEAAWGAVQQEPST
jgi:DNA-binding response OmpR family regulator